MSKFIDDFKNFAIKGNAIDMAIGIIIGASFTTVVNSIVNDILMPPIGMLIGNVDFTNLFWVIKPGEQVPPPYSTLQAAQDAGAVTVNYGLFINNLISFLIVALTVFLIVRALNRMEKTEEAEKQAEEAPTIKDCPYCLEKIDINATRCPHCTSQLESSGS